MESEDNPYAPGALHTRDPLHDLQLLRDMQIVNEHTQRELGPLPPGGLPVEPRRRPSAPYRPLPPRHDLMETPEMNLTTMAAAAVLASAATACAHKEPEIRLNPAPQERYEITMTITDAPGPFGDIGGWVQYDVPDKDCAPTRETFQKTYHLSPEKFLPLVFSREGDGIYTTEMAVDALLDEDYFEMGVCRWRMTYANMKLKGKTVSFMPFLRLNELREEQPKTLYFSKRTYHSTELDNFPVSGRLSPSEFGPSVQDELFTITLTPRRIAP